MSGFSKFPQAPPPPPLTHRQQWAALLTAGGAVITAPALWGAHGFARHFLVLLGLVIVIFGALGFIRDWHMPFVRNRADDPGLVDRRRKRQADSAAEIIRVEQARVFAEAEKLRFATEAFRSVIWPADHRVAMLFDMTRVIVVALGFPRGLDPAKADGWSATCRIEHEGTVYEGTGRTGPFGIDLTFPDDFLPSMKHPFSLGHYEVEWFPEFPAVVERDSFDIIEYGQLQR